MVSIHSWIVKEEKQVTLPHRKVRKLYLEVIAATFGHMNSLLVTFIEEQMMCIVDIKNVRSVTFETQVACSAIILFLQNNVHLHPVKLTQQAFLQQFRM